jgi:anti-sigma factor RsiW
MAKGHPQRHDLLDYVEGSLDAADRSELKQHLDSCAACRELVADAEAGKRLLAASPPLELSQSRADAIVAALDRPAPAPERRRPAWRFAAVVAVALAIAVPLSYVALQGGGGDDDATSAGAATGAAEGSEDAGAETGAATPETPQLTVVRGVDAKPAAVARALRTAGYTAEVEADTVIVTVPDANVKDVATLLDDQFEAGNTIVFWRVP